ncbi:MAG: MBOAT family O-acyltransferase, partial [Bacteroidia bacterium]
AKVMGFKLMTNFKRPYLSRSVSEFWTRWHISLSTWFKDYLYISLGGNRVSIPRWCFNLFFVFVVSGLWHGANWTFIIWGALNGFYLVTALLLNKYKLFIPNKKYIKIVKAVIQIFVTFCLISIAWIFFRANSMSDAIYILKKIVSFDGGLFMDTPSTIIFSFFGIMLLMLTEFWIENFKRRIIRLKSNAAIRHISYATLIILILMIGVFDGGQFIYFQF